MPVDSSIYFQQQPVQIQDPLNKLAQVGQFQAMQNQNKLAQYSLDKAARDDATAQGLNDLYRTYMRPDGTLDRSGLISGAAQGGFGSSIPALQKSFADADKALADVAHTKSQTSETDAKALNLALQQGRDVLTQANDPAAGRQWLISSFNNPVTGPTFQKLGSLDEALARYDQQAATPDGFAKWKQGAMLNADKLVQYTTPDANTVANNLTSRQNNADTNATSRANNSATNAVTMRGQNMTDARQREATDAGRVPAGYRRTPDGNLEAIPGGPAEKAKEPTEFQGKSASFGARAEAADKILNDLSGKYSPAGINLKTSLPGPLETIGNMTLSPNSQKAEQAQRDFINAVLRQESGAAIAQSEFDNAKRQYFPQPGDSQAVIDQKAANRQLVIQGFKNNSGPLANKSYGTQPAAPSTPATSSDGWSVTEVK